MKAKAGDVFTIYNHYLNRYTACQITKVEPNGSAVCLPLDWSGPEPLGAHQLGGLKPLYKDFMYWPRCLRLCNVAAEVPSHYIYVGNRPSFCQESSDVYGPWDDGYEVYRQLQWQEIPEGQRRVFKSAIDSTETVQLAGTEVRVNTRRLHDKYVPFGHAEDLRSLPCLSALNLECWHPGLLEYLRTNPFLTELSFAVPGCQLTTGLRLGEICGLRWEDFGAEHGVLNIQRTVHVEKGGVLTTGDTKTYAGTRKIVLPASTVQCLRERKEAALTDWIFPNPLKPELPVNPRAAYSRLKVLLKDIGLPSIRFHDLRHTFSTHALSSGVDAKTLSGILGHSRASFTLDTYTHVTGDMQKRASEVVGDFLTELLGEELKPWQNAENGAAAASA